MWRAGDFQVATTTVRRAAAERQSAFIQRVDLPDLCGMECRCRQCEVRVTASVGQDLHFVIDATRIAIGGIRQGKIAVHESVSWLVGPFDEAQGTMTQSQSISKLFQLPPRICRSVGRIQSVMQVDFNFSPALVAVLGKGIEQVSIVLLSRIKIGVDEGPSFLVTP